MRGLRVVFGRRLLGLGVAGLGVWLLLLVVAGPAFAGAWWRVASRTAPTFLEPGGKATIIVTATNVGDGGVNAAGTPVTIKDTLPPGLEATAIKGAPAFEELEEGHQMICDVKSVSCSSQPETLPAFQALDVAIQVNVKPNASVGEANTVSVQGGEQEDQPGLQVPPAALNVQLTFGLSTPFGVEEAGYTLTPEEEGGTLDKRAGSHPFQLTTTLNLNQSVEVVPERGLVASAPELPRDLSFNLPPGLVGDPRAVPQCPTVDFLAISSGAINQCQAASAIGVVVVSLDEPSKFHDITRIVPLWNLEPAQGEPARLGFEALTVPVVLDTAVRTNSDYGVTVSVKDTPEAAQILGTEVTIWGEPGDPRHDQSRGWACVLGGAYYVNHEVPCEAPSPRPTTPFLTLPTSCTGQAGTTVEGDSWPVKSLGSEPGQIFTLQGSSTEDELKGFEGCAALPFSPAISAEPVQEEGGMRARAHAASSPAGLNFDVKVPQQATLEAGGLAEADVKDTTVTLPEGVLLNPSSANGLQACSESQIGFEGVAGADPLSPGAVQPLRFSSSPAGCPDASKLGVVDIKTPLLEGELHGSVYLAAPAPLGEGGRNPFDSLLALYVVAEDPAAGIRVKLAGEAKANGETGQLTTTFQDTPQVPFEELQLQLFGGPRASVTTPPLCGNYQSAASFTPWSSSTPVETTSILGEFELTSGPGGSACADPLPFVPSFQAGSTSLQAGGFTGFALQVDRPDGDQALTGVSVTLPAGVAALLSSVTPCGEPQASRGECSPESEIGQATAFAGLGPDPFAETGRVYLTGPYDNAPFGLSIVTPAVAGPFNLGTVVVRSTISVNPETAAVTISSGLPTIVQGVGMTPSGIPLQLKAIIVTVDRPGFEFNPTNCNPMAITGTLTGAQGGSEAVSSRFQVTNCESLPFAPKLTASVAGHASKPNGVTFTVKLESKGLGQADVKKVDLQLPTQLPSRLSTIQKACVDNVFDANPATCSPESVIGMATIHTPVLKSPLSGPAYLVSHGGAAFPDVEFVLQGEGITLLLDGQTFIDEKTGITYSRFEAAPDAPFTTFETVLPAGPHSALGAFVPVKDNYSLCGQKLKMPTEITSQAGTTIKQTTSIAITGCKGVASYQHTQTQQLAKALKTCRTQNKHSPHKRSTCETRARRRYPTKKNAPKKPGSASKHR